ncbi:hypothetical protein CN918_28595 [Priestia megaterium]|nr:hypothetical protein CN918_28595 [Priestia megaterium]
MHNYFYDINPLAERQAQREMLQEMKEACKYDVVEWLSVTITKRNMKLFTRQRIEFVFRLFSNPKDMYTHFSLVLYNQSIKAAQEVMLTLLKEFQNEVTCPVQDVIKIQNESREETLTLVINDTEVEQGMVYTTNEGDTVLVMGWDNERVYFLLNPAPNCLIGKEPLKSLSIESYAQLFA